MACAVARSRAVRVLIPVNRCDNLVVGVNMQSVSELLADAVEKIRQVTEEKEERICCGKQDKIQIK